MTIDTNRWEAAYNYTDHLRGLLVDYDGDEIEPEKLQEILNALEACAEALRRIADLESPGRSMRHPEISRFDIAAEALDRLDALRP